MNSSSIMLAFALAGFITIGLHNVVVGPIDLKANHVLQQLAKKHHQNTVVNAQKAKASISKS